MKRTKLTISMMKKTITTALYVLLLPLIGVFFASNTLAKAPDSPPASPLVILTTFSERPLASMLKSFKQKYPDVVIKVIHRRTSSSIQLLNQSDIKDIDLVLSSSPFLMHNLTASKKIVELPVPRATPKWLHAHTLLSNQKITTIGYSGAGLIWNNDYLHKYNLLPPQSWEALLNPNYFQHLTMSTPSRSGTTQLMVESILQNYGWKKGWAMLLNIGANLTTISSRSFGVSEAVSRGMVAAGPVIDSYAINAMKKFEFLDFSYLPNVALMPTYLGVVNHPITDPNATRFLNFVLSDSTQNQLLTNGFSKHAITDDSLAQNNHFYLDQTKMKQRESVVNLLFDQAITYQLPQLNDTWLAIITASQRFKHNPLILEEIEQAKHLTFTMPISEQDAFNALPLLKNTHTSQIRNYDPNNEKIARDWQRLLEHQLQKANKIITSINKKAAGQP